MESIYFEKQEGSLCAQHCLNALLQGPYFTAVDLAMHAKQLDDEERMRMAESGIDSDEYRLFLEQPSSNMDDSGYFSVQVISSCLSVWGLDLIRYSSTERLALRAQRNPESMMAYICNYRDHWFTVRKLASQWFNLNSLASGPKLISDTYLGLFLAQLQDEGYSIFIVFGDIPQCEADYILKHNPIQPDPDSEPDPDSQSDAKKPEGRNSGKGGNNPQPFDGAGHRLGGDSNSPRDAEEIQDLQRAIHLSLLPQQRAEDMELKQAIQLSLRCSPHNSTVSNEGAPPPPNPNPQQAEDADLQAALSLGLDSTQTEEIRRRRLAYFEKFNNTT